MYIVKKNLLIAFRDRYIVFKKIPNKDREKVLNRIN